MVSKGIIDGSKIKVKENTVEVVVFPEGFSDHLPVSNWQKTHRD